MRERMTHEKEPSIAEAPWRYVPGFLTRRDADRMLEWLRGLTCWHQEHVRLFGRRHRTPRLVSWFGNESCCYRYSGIDHQAVGWPGELEPVCSRLADELGWQPNFVLLNRYRSGADSMGWHTDDEPALVRSVAGISLGATRRLLLRPGGQGGSVKLDLAHGSLLLLPRDLSHCLPRTRRHVGERISLTFRLVR